MRVSGRSANAKHGFPNYPEFILKHQTLNLRMLTRTNTLSSCLRHPSIRTYCIHTYIHTCIHTYTHILVSKCNLRSPLNSESLAPKPPVQFGGCGGDPRRVRAKADSMQGFHGRFRLLGFRAFGSVCGV